MMSSCCLTLLLSLTATKLVTSEMTCGTADDVTNFGSSIPIDSSGLHSKFESLDTSCFGRVVFAIATFLLKQNCLISVEMYNHTNMAL